MMTDPIADFLTRIRNAQLAKHTSLSVPYSQIKHHIAEVMKKNDFLLSVKKDSSQKFPRLYLELPAKKIHLKKISRSGQRIYTPAKKIFKVLNGLGIAIISTSEGIMTGYQARSKNIGGEVLCEIW